ncbi:MAG: spore coat U domain-containing protein [Pseudomonadota bacterium]
MNSKSLLRHLLVIGALGSASQFAVAATSTAQTFGVSANVASACLISATALGFGTYDPQSASDNLAQSTVTVTCSKNAPVTVALDKGIGGASETTRTMSNGTQAPMNYALFSDSARSANWGTTAGAVSATGNGLGAGVVLNVYGKIPKSQLDVGVGAYADTITATVTY